MDSRGRILEAALRVFAERGFKGATIKEIAREAGVRSSGLIYWYFEDKHALFREVLRDRAPIIQAIAEPSAMMELPPEEVLPRLGRAYFAFDRMNVKMLQLLLGEAIRNPDVADAFVRSGPARVLAFLGGYLEHQVELGRLRAHDARSSSRAFIGMLIPQLAGKLFLPALAEGGPTDEEHLQTAVSIFLEGLRPEG